MSGSVITVAQQKGGSGKTTLAANLAIALRQSGLSVGLIDTDPQGSLGRWFMTRAEDDPALVEGMGFSTSSAWGIPYETRKLTDTHDVVLIDTPPKADSDLRPALRVADLVLVPVAQSHVDLWATEGVLDLANREEKPAVIVMNRGRAGTRLASDVEAAAAKMGVSLAKAQMAHRVIYAETLGLGRAVTEGRKTPAREEMQALTRELAERLQAG